MLFVLLARQDGTSVDLRARTIGGVFTIVAGEDGVAQAPVLVAEASAPVTLLAADSSRAAFRVGTGAGASLAIWDPLSTRLRLIDPFVPPTAETASLEDILVSGSRVVWTFSAVQPRSYGETDLVADELVIARADWLSGEQLGNLHGEGGLVALNRWRLRDDRQWTLWVLTGTNVRQVADARGMLVAAADTRLVVREGANRFRVLTREGRQVRRVSFSAPPRAEPVVDRGAVVALTDAGLEVGRGPREGTVVIELGPAVRHATALAGIAGNVVALTAPRAVHLVDLVTRRTASLRVAGAGPPIEARLERDGLFVLVQDRREVVFVPGAGIRRLLGPGRRGRRPPEDPAPDAPSR